MRFDLPDTPPGSEALREELRGFLAEAGRAWSPATRARSWMGFDRGFSRQVGARYQIVNARLLRRQIESESSANQKGAHEQSHGSQYAEQRGDAECCGSRQQNKLRRKNNFLPVDDVSQRTREQSKQERRSSACSLHQRNH